MQLKVLKTEVFVYKTINKSRRPTSLKQKFLGKLKNQYCLI